MADASHGRVRRKVLGDATLRANEDTTHRRRAEKPGYEDITSSPIAAPTPTPPPHNESQAPNGSLAVRHGPDSAQPSPHNKRISAVINEEVRPRNTKRDSEISNASTNASSNTGRRRKTHIGPWQLGRTVGRGGCSRVRIVRHGVTGEYGAAKIVSKAMADEVRALSLANLVQSAETDPSLRGSDCKLIPFGLEREICIMKLLDHPNIVRLHDIWENRNEIYLIMDYIEGGELFQYIGEQGTIQEIEVVHLFRQIIAALLYCHRLHIHHRDLKPENILLDRNTFQIKIVDFGMAALQPLGTKLTTPCGSPHYAAPEVIKTTSYDGAKADIWSCGVILFVMLTGNPPFNYSGKEADLRPLFRMITRAEYTMPPGLSIEAQDLIRRILVPDPKRRISIEAIWKHPFLHKYDAELGFEGEKATLDYWVGPTPSLTAWEPLDRSTVDREIFRYLRTLWHSEDSEVLMQRLLSNEGNQEKYFYSALVKYRNDQLEDYRPAFNTIAHSTSDHHHHVRPPTRRSVLSSSRHKRSQSAYSILNDEHMYSKHSFYEPPASDASYDPFRASREPLIPVGGHTPLNQNVTVRRGPSNGSHKLRPATAMGHRSRTGSSLRVKALRNNSNRQSSAISRGSSRSTPSAQSQRSAAARRRSVSRSSMVSSHWPSSPPMITARPVSLAKRGVSFSHLRHSSVASAHTNATGSQYTPEPRRYVSSGRKSALSSPHSPLRRVTRPAASPIATRVKVRKPESPSKYIQSEVRKVSTELSKAMEEAFNRSSISSSIETGATGPKDGQINEYESPLTSFANTRDSGGSNLLTPQSKRVLSNRPLPPIPDDTPRTYLQRKLVQTRDEIAQRFEGQGLGENIEQISIVLENLDRLIHPGTQRASSAPTKPEHALPVISEESRVDGQGQYEPLSLPFRAVTDPVRPDLHGRRAVTDQMTTIRMIDHSPTPIAPLNIRKRSAASTTSRGDGHTGIAPPPPLPVVRPLGVQSELVEARSNESTAINHRASLRATEAKEHALKKKKSSWFRRNTEEKERPQLSEPKPVKTGRLEIPQAWHGLDDRVDKAGPSQVGPAMSQQPSRQSERSNSSEFPIRNCVTASHGLKERKSFLGLFGKKTKEEKAEKGKAPLDLAANFSTSSIYSSSVDPTEDQNIGRAPEVQTNWLYRFLNIKPAVKYLVFQVGRGKAQKGLVRLLEDWQRFGVRGVSAEGNAVNFRVDKNNHLKIKPVSLVVELFVVLHHNRNTKITIARFTQTKGAASSFRKVTDVVEDVFRARNMLIEDEARRNEILSIMRV